MDFHSLAGQPRLVSLSWQGCEKLREEREREIERERNRERGLERAPVTSATFYWPKELITPAQILVNEIDVEKNPIVPVTEAELRKLQKCHVSTSMRNDTRGCTGLMSSWMKQRMYQYGFWCRVV